MLKLYVVRHGQTEHNLQGIIQGYLDTDLNETGRAQAELVARKLQDVNFDLAFSSDLSRARDTGMAILNRQRDRKTTLEEDVALRERDMGELSGTRGPVPRPMPKSVESSSHFMKRCLTWFEQTIIPLAKSGDDLTVLTTSHGAYIITLFRTLISPRTHGGLGYDVAEGLAMNHCGNTAIAIVTVDEKGHGRVEAFNDQAHLSATPDELHIADAAPFDHR